MTTQQTEPVALGRVGIWSMELRGGDRGEVADAAAELDEAGWGALWIPGAGAPGIWEDADHLLDSTERTSVALGVASIWGPDGDGAALAFPRLTARHGNRLLAGFGVSNPHSAAAAGRSFGSALSAMNSYLDSLDAASPPLPAGHRVLAALGPRMVELAGRRASGVHPFLVTPESSQATRQALGPGAIIAPHQAVVLDTDADRAREIARSGIGMYIGFASYQANLRRLGFTDADVVPGGSDGLIDQVVAWGTVEDVVRRVEAHHQAGADHVALQVLTGHGRLPREEWRELSAALATR